jgi:hypothetical protein
MSGIRLERFEELLEQNRLDQARLFEGAKGCLEVMIESKNNLDKELVAEELERLKEYRKVMLGVLQREEIEIKKCISVEKSCGIYLSDFLIKITERSAAKCG